LTTEKLNAVSAKRILYETLQKNEATMVFKCAKKIKKKNEFLLCSASADKETF